MEIREDIDLGFMRWLTINVPGDAGRGILLEVPGPPSMSEETAAQVRELLSKGATGGHLFFRCDDAHKTYAELKEKGVDISEEPVDQPYGIDFGLRDPFGNHLRTAQTRGCNQLATPAPLRRPSPVQLPTAPGTPDQGKGLWRSW